MIMKVSYAWLQDYFSKPLPNPEKVQRAITMHAFEIESAETITDDTILDINVLPDRAHDSLSHWGIAKEISAILDLPIKDVFHASKQMPVSQKLEVKVEDTNLCRRFSACLVQGIKVTESPDWLKKRLVSVGQKSINNIVDLTNYVMFSIGQPMHVYDADRLSDKKGKYIIGVRQTENSGSVTLLDGQEKEIPKSTPVIFDGGREKKDGSELIGLAGIKGGQTCLVDESTKNIIFEAANFDPVVVRKTSHSLGLRTEASKRFEAEISKELTFDAIVLAVQTLQTFSKNTKVKIEGIVDVYPKKEKKHEITISPSFVNRRLGTQMRAEDVEPVLKRLKFDFNVVENLSQKADQNYRIFVPFERLDLKRKEDLTEEIGRIYGYENITSKALPEIFRKKGTLSASEKHVFYESLIRQNLVRAGFFEVYTYAFQKHGELKLLNPQSKEKPFLRSSLSRGLFEGLKLNVRNADLLGLEQIKLFEIGNVFLKKGEEKRTLALGVMNADKLASEKPTETIARVVDELAGITNIEIPNDINTEDGAALLECDLSRIISELPDKRDEDFLELLENKAEEKKDQMFSPISPYPFVLRDIAVFVPEGTSEKEIADSIRDKAGNLLVNLRLFDTFERSFEDGTKHFSYAFRLAFLSDQKTLSDGEVNVIMKKITEALNSLEGVQVR